MSKLLPLKNTKSGYNLSWWQLLTVLLVIDNMNEHSEKMWNAKNPEKDVLCVRRKPERRRNTKELTQTEFWNWVNIVGTIRQLSRANDTRVPSYFSRPIVLTTVDPRPMISHGFNWESLSFPRSCNSSVHTLRQSLQYQAVFHKAVQYLAVLRENNQTTGHLGY